MHTPIPFSTVVSPCFSSEIEPPSHQPRNASLLKIKIKVLGSERLRSVALRLRISSPSAIAWHASFLTPPPHCRFVVTPLSAEAGRLCLYGGIPGGLLSFPCLALSLPSNARTPVYPLETCCPTPRPASRR